MDSLSVNLMPVPARALSCATAAFKRGQSIAAGLTLVKMACTAGRLTQSDGPKLIQAEGC